MCCDLARARTQNWDTANCAQTHTHPKMRLFTGIAIDVCDSAFVSHLRTQAVAVSTERSTMEHWTCSQQVLDKIRRRVDESSSREPMQFSEKLCKRAACTWRILRRRKMCFSIFLAHETQLATLLFDCKGTKKSVQSAYLYMGKTWLKYLRSFYGSL